MPFVTVNGVRLYYEEHGSGTPILGIHGAGSSAVFWEEAAERLSALGRVIIYDRRGCTRSERPVPYEITSVAEQAEDARALLLELDAAPAVLIGRSYGATVALELALSDPQLVHGAALLEAGPMGLSPEYDEWFRSLRAKLDDVAAAGRIGAVAETVALEVFETWDGLPQSFRDVFAENSPALLAEIRGEEALSDNAHLRELAVPALIVSAEDSPRPLQHATAGLVQALPGARVVRVAGGHAIDPAHTSVLEFVSDVLAE
jgi:pimeloyl-ACP methyl ester carboxylesterase